MKSITTILLFACLCAVLFSCQKIDINPELKITAPAADIVSPIHSPDPVIGNVNTAVQFAGNWVLVNDSTYSTGTSIKPYGTGTNYLGQPGDHFHFTSDGKLYIKEGDRTDTAAYTVTNDKKVIINYLYHDGAPVSNYGSVIATFDQVALTASTVTLSGSAAIPGGGTLRIINLKR